MNGQHRPASIRRERHPDDGHPDDGHPDDDPGDPDSVARAICLRLLTVQPRTRAELATALARRGVPDDAAERVLGRFAEAGLVDDQAFADAWVGSRQVGRGLARRALASELRRRGVDAPTVDAAVATVDGGAEEEMARTLVRRRLAVTRQLEPAVRVRRLVGMLARKGYPSSLAFRVVREEITAAGLAGSDLLDDHDLQGVDLDADAMERNMDVE